MLKLLRKLLFTEKEEIKEEINLKQLPEWLGNKVSSLEFNRLSKQYLQRIKEIKKELQENVAVLKNQEISDKDKKQVQDRVKNIVVGHKNHYVLEIERFTENLTVVNHEFSTIENCQNILSFNKNLDKDLDELAKRTAKSYQAAQHLFFDNVEKTFNLLGELNKRVKDFENKIKDYKIRELQNVENLIRGLHSEIVKKENLSKEIKDKENILAKENKSKEEQEHKLKTLQQSKEHNRLLELKKSKENLFNEYKKAEHQIFSFFSRLQKAFKKYERVALDNKMIRLYLENSTAAFLEDEELKILSVLQGLKNNLNNLNFDEKQRSNYLELVEKANKGYLKELHNTITKLELQKLKLNQELENNKIEKDVENFKKEVKDIEIKIEKTRLRKHEQETKLEKINLDDNKNELVQKIKEVFNVELKIN